MLSRRQRVTVNLFRPRARHRRRPCSSATRDTCPSFVLHLPRSHRYALWKKDTQPTIVRACHIINQDRVTPAAARPSLRKVLLNVRHSCLLRIFVQTAVMTYRKVTHRRRFLDMTSRVSFLLTAPQPTPKKEMIKVAMPSRIDTVWAIGRTHLKSTKHLKALHLQYPLHQLDIFLLCYQETAAMKAALRRIT